MIFDFFVGLLIFGASALVLRDALKHRIKAPLKWAAGVAFIWIIVLPLYLYRRKKMIEEARHSPEEPIKKEHIAIGTVIILFLSFIIAASRFFSGELPKCNSPEVSKVLTEMLSDSNFSDVVQYNYDKSNEVRYCHLERDGDIYSFKVRWYDVSDKETFVVFFTDN